jgi:hypothetical protein
MNLEKLFAAQQIGAAGGQLYFCFRPRRHGRDCSQHTPERSLHAGLYYQRTPLDHLCLFDG